MLTHQTSSNNLQDDLRPKKEKVRNKKTRKIHHLKKSYNITKQSNTSYFRWRPVFSSSLGLILKSFDIDQKLVSFDSVTKCLIN